MYPIDETEFAKTVKKIQANTQARRLPETYDRATHPRARDHSAFINRVSASVSSPRPVDASPSVSNHAGRSDAERYGPPKHNRR